MFLQVHGVFGLGLGRCSTLLATASTPAVHPLMPSWTPSGTHRSSAPRLLQGCLLDIRRAHQRVCQERTWLVLVDTGIGFLQRRPEVASLVLPVVVHLWTTNHKHQMINAFCIQQRSCTQVVRHGSYAGPSYSEVLSAGLLPGLAVTVFTCRPAFASRLGQGRAVLYVPPA